MTTLLPQTLDGLIEFAATHHLMMIAVDSRNSEFDVDRISNYQGEASLAIPLRQRKSPIQDEYIEKYLAERELDLTATLDGETAYKTAEFGKLTCLFRSRYGTVASLKFLLDRFGFG